jgi:hypothetical protein
MRISLFIFLATILCYSPGFAQKTKVYRAWVTLTDGDQINGAMSFANEDGLVILDWNTRDTVAVLEGKQIKVLKFRRKGAMGRGAWIGALGGAAAGVIIGLADGDDVQEGYWDIWNYTAEQKAVAAGIVLAVPGTFIGMIIGALPKRFPIKGDNETYLASLPQIQQYVVQ